MRFIAGAFGVIAALGFVTYSAVTTYHTASDMTTQFRELAGWAAAGIVLWECLGLLFVRQCWANGSRWLAVGGLCLVLAAAVYTVRLDLRFHVAGQSDLAADRQNSAEKLTSVKAELTKARADRDALQKVRRLTDAQLDERERLNARISALEQRWETSVVVSSPMPEAGWASRMLGGISTDEDWWRDALMVFGLVFWALARMIALPLAVASMQGVRKPQEASGRAKAPEAPSVPLKVFPPSAPRTALPELGIPGYLARKTIPMRADGKPVDWPYPDPTSPEIPDNSPPEPPADSAPPVETKPEPAKAVGPRLVDASWKPEPKTKAKPSKSERFADIDAPTRDWLNTGRAVPVALSLGSSGPDVWDAFNAYCLAQHPPIKPLNPSHFGRSLRRVGVASAKTSRGVRYALRLVKIPVRRAA